MNDVWTVAARTWRVSNCPSTLSPWTPKLIASRALRTSALRASREYSCGRRLWSSEPNVTTVGVSYKQSLNWRGLGREGCRCFGTTNACLKKRSHHQPGPQTKNGGQSATDGSSAKSVESTGSITDASPQESSPTTPSPIAEDDWDTPLPGGDLGQEQITKVLGAGVGIEEGNFLLRVLQSRRTSGSLADVGLSFTAPNKVESKVAYRALEYLRSTHPVDEQAAAEAYAIKVEQQVQEELEQRARGLGLMKAEDGQTPGAELQGTEYGRAKYGTSGLQEIRDRNKKIRDALKREKEKQEAERRAHFESVVQKVGPLAALTDRELKPTFKETSKELYANPSIAARYYRQKALHSTDKIAPKMTKWQRLGPSYILGAVVLAGCVLLASVYHAPPQSARLFPDIAPAASTIGALVLMNVFVWVAWRFRPAWPIMNKYLLLTPGLPVALSTIGNNFCHVSIYHLLGNMAVLMVFGPMLYDQVGRGTFLAIYIVGGVTGSLAYLTNCVMRGKFVSYQYGSSACNAAVTAAACLTQTHYVFYIPFTDSRLPMWMPLVLIASAAWDFAHMRRPVRAGKQGGVIDHLSHVAGYATGTTAAGMLYWRSWRQRNAEERIRTRTGSARPVDGSAGDGAVNRGPP